jgi:hypothetical protein
MEDPTQAEPEVTTETEVTPEPDIRLVLDANELENIWQEIPTRGRPDHG